MQLDEAKKLPMTDNKIQQMEVREKDERSEVKKVEAVVERVS